MTERLLRLSGTSLGESDRRDATVGGVRLRVLETRRDVRFVHATGPRGDWATSRRTILRRERNGEWTPVARFPFSGAVDALGALRLTERLLRLDKCNVWPMRNGLLLGIRGGKVYRIDPETDRVDALFEIQGDCVMSRALAEDAAGNVYFGEYFMNADRVPVKIWKVDADLSEGRPVYAFDEPRVRHVHAIHADPYAPGRLWSTTGDFAGECFLFYSDDGFETVHAIGEGDQLWRAVGLHFSADSLHWLTDTHIDQNRIVSLRRDATEPEIHGERDASSWYIAETREGDLLATTTVEPGPGIQTDRVRLLASRDAERWVTVAEFPKDRYPMRGFGFGSLWLPAGELTSEGFWVSGEGVEGLDGISMLCRLENEA
ncbi:MAG: hypothetical protein NXI30_17020 [bacterium]|nr:hypothetical protein [bacterium]